MRMSLPRGRAARLGAVAAVAACVLVAAGTGPASASALARPGWRLVSYRGYQFEVPGSWPVIQLAADPHQCVRFDRHAVYLGRPGPNEDCPARGAGRNTEALLVQPAAGPGAARSAQNLVADLITVTAPRISVTATYGGHRAQVLQILASLPLPAPVAQAATPTAASPAGAPSRAAGAPQFVSPIGHVLHR
jgi:hypothetical protein